MVKNFDIGTKTAKLKMSAVSHKKGPSNSFDIAGELLKRQIDPKDL